MFPELQSKADEAVEDALKEAVLMHRKVPRATLLVAAHLLTIMEGAPLGSRGEPQHEQIGPGLVSYMTQAEVSANGGSRESFWTSTTYGRRFLIIEQRRRLGSVVVA